MPRFYYEREGQFTPDQLVQIRQSSLSRLICDNADGVFKVPADAFLLEDPADFTPCGQLPTVDLFLWKEFGGGSLLQLRVVLYGTRIMCAGMVVQNEYC